MFAKIRTSMFAAVAAAAAVAAVAATTTSADARGFGGGGGFGRGGMGGHVGMRMGGGVRMGHVGMRTVGIRTVGVRHVGIRHVGIRTGNWCRYSGRCGIHVRWHRPWVVPVATAGLVATSYAVAPTVATAKPCTCLTKEYTPDNLVVFKDLCTKEVASAPAGNTQALLPAPQPEAAPPAQQ